MYCHTIQKLQSSAVNKKDKWGKSLLLIVHDGGAVSSHGLLFDHTDELKGAAERSIRIGPFRTLEMSHLQDIVILSQRTKRKTARDKVEHIITTEN